MVFLFPNKYHHSGCWTFCRKNNEVKLNEWKMTKCSKLAKVFIVNFEQISYLSLVSLLLTWTSKCFLRTFLNSQITSFVRLVSRSTSKRVLRLINLEKVPMQTAIISKLSEKSKNCLKNAEACLEPSWTSTMDLFCKSSKLYCKCLTGF